jgi:hypothetical protein
MYSTQNLLPTNGLVEQNFTYILFYPEHCLLTHCSLKLILPRIARYPLVENLV